MHIERGWVFIYVPRKLRGSYGELHLGKNMTSNEYVAIKLERRNAPDPQLMMEWTLYQLLGCSQENAVAGFPRVFYFGPIDIGLKIKIQTDRQKDRINKRITDTFTFTQDFCFFFLDWDDRCSRLDQNIDKRC